MLLTDDCLDRISTASLYPPFAASLRLLVAACKARGAIYVATSGLRTYAEQDKLYEIGRSTGEPGHIVTRAKAGYSNHNWGISADFTRDRDDNVGQLRLKPYKPDSAKYYAILAEEAERLGLESGLHWKGDFQDSNHIQLPIAKHGVDLARLRREYVLGGHIAVFRFLDSITWFHP